MRKALLSLAVVAIGLGGFVAYLYGSAATERNDCPGRIVCPLNGEEICKDDCPLIDATRADCPGKIECPLTGELICRDECPVETSPKGDTSAGASCCAASD